MVEFVSGLLVRYRLAKDKIKKLGATSEKTALKPEELGIEEWILKKLTEGWCEGDIRWSLLR